MSSNTNGNNEVPKTITDVNVYFGILFVLGIILVTLSIFLFPILGFWKNMVWAFILTITSLGGLVVSGGVAIDIGDWEGKLIFNPWSRTRRAVFPGFQWKLLWEQPEQGATELKREISSGATSGEIEEFSTNDPAEIMEVGILIHMLLNVIGKSPEEASENFIRFRSVEEHALMVIVRQEVIKMFRKYYSGKELEQLANTSAIQEEVLKDADNKKVLDDLQKKYGIHIGVILKSSKPNKATQDMKRAPAMAEALMDARGILLTPRLRKDKTIIPPMDEKVVDRAALLIDPNTDYKEERFVLDISAPDLKNMTHLSMAPGVFGGHSNNNSQKKGNKK